MIHSLTIVHSFTCVTMSAFIYFLLKKKLLIDRRQYYMMMGLTTVVSVVYFSSFMYVVYYAVIQSPGEHSIYIVMNGMVDMITSISNNMITFFLTLTMNFILIFGIFAVNLCSLYLADLSTSLEQRRTGGRGQNELELNDFKK
jgi:uncharacterized protein involved in cysteine biosynthesis